MGGCRIAGGDNGDRHVDGERAGVGICVAGGDVEAAAGVGRNRAGRGLPVAPIDRGREVVAAVSLSAATKVATSPENGAPSTALTWNRSGLEGAMTWAVLLAVAVAPPAS